MIDLNINYADLFAEEVQKNPNDYPDTIHLAVKRYLRWKERDDIWFDLEKANAMLYFTETFVRHCKGEWAGKALELELWQKFFFSNIYGWQKENERGQAVRVIRTGFDEVPKKNGKTLMGTAPVLYGMFGEGKKGVDIYVSATNFDQAQMAAIPIKLTIENSPDLRDLVRVYHGKEQKVKSIIYPFEEDGITYQNQIIILSKDNEGNEGKNPYICLFDEVHANRSTEQWNNLNSAQAAQTESLNIVTTTAGKDPSALGVQIYNYAKDVLEKDNDDSWFVMIYEPNKGYDWEDRKVWKMVNPNYGITVNSDFLENEFKKAKQNSFNKAEFLSKHLDVYVNYAETYFNLDQLEKVLVDDLGELEGLECVAGVDLSRRTDLTCVSLNFPTFDDEGNPMLKVKQMYFIPEHGIEEKEKQRNVPYRELAEKGFVTLCPGKTVDEDMVDQYIMDAFEKYNMLQINYDPALAAKLVERWEMLGIPCIEVPQYPTHMNEPFDDFELLLLQERTLNGKTVPAIITDNPLFIFCTSNAKIVTNINNLKVPSKRKSPEHIDGFVAFLIAHKETLNMMEPIVADEDFDEYLDEIYR